MFQYIILATIALTPLQVGGATVKTIAPPNQPIEQETKQIVPPLLEKIALCESSNNPLATNKKSSAKGLYQFLDSSWKFYGNQLWHEDIINKNVFDPEDSKELAVFVFEKYGSRPWSESSGCWSK